MLTVFHHPVRRRRLGQREGGVDQHANGPRFDQRPDVLVHGAGDDALLRHRARAKDRPGDGEPLAEDRGRADLRAMAADLADQHETAIHSQHLQVALEVVAADDVEDEVDPAPVGRLAGGLDEVDLAIVEGPLGAERLAGRTLLGAARRREHPGAQRPGQLDGRGADAAGAAVHEHRLPGGETAALDHVGPDGERRLRHRGRLREAEAPGNRQALFGRRTAVLGVAAAGDQRADVVADPPRRHVAADFDDGAGDLEAGDIRRSGRRRVLALALHQVRPVHASGRDLDQHLPGAGRRSGPLDRRQDLGSTWFSYLNGNHSRLSFLTPPTGPQIHPSSFHHAMPMRSGRRRKPSRPSDRRSRPAPAPGSGRR